MNVVDETVQSVDVGNVFCGQNDQMLSVVGSDQALAQAFGQLVELEGGYCESPPQPAHEFRQGGRGADLEPGQQGMLVSVCPNAVESPVQLFQQGLLGWWQAPLCNSVSQGGL